MDTRCDTFSGLISNLPRPPQLNTSSSLFAVHILNNGAFFALDYCILFACFALPALSLQLEKSEFNMPHSRDDLSTLYLLLVIPFSYLLLCLH